MNIRRRGCVVVFLMAAFLLPWSFAAASQPGGGGSENVMENDPACKAVGAFVSAAGTVPLIRGVNAAIQTGLAAAGIALFSEPLAKKCEKNMQEIIDYYRHNPIGYDDWMRDHCGGSSFNCPGELSVNPATCGTFIVCAPYTVDVAGPGVSILEFMGGMQVIDMAYQFGSWGPVPDPGGPPYYDPR